jgi:hypothetical protein
LLKYQIKASTSDRKAKIMVKKGAQFTSIIAISIIVTAFTVVIYITHPDSFESYFGKINPFFMYFLCLYCLFFPSLFLETLIRKGMSGPAYSSSHS